MDSQDNQAVTQSVFDPLQSLTNEDAQKAAQAINDYMLAQPDESPLHGARAKYIRGFYGFYYRDVTRIWLVEQWEDSALFSFLFRESADGRVFPFSGTPFLPQDLYPEAATPPVESTVQEGGAA